METIVSAHGAMRIDMDNKTADMKLADELTDKMRMVCGGSEIGIVIFACQCLIIEGACQLTVEQQAMLIEGLSRVSEFIAQQSILTSTPIPTDPHHFH